MGIIVAVFVAIIVLLVGVIVVIISRHKKARRSDILGTLPHSMHQDSLTMDKRMNYNIKVSGLSIPSSVLFCSVPVCAYSCLAVRVSAAPQMAMDDNESIDKSSLYHEPFNVNMYTSAASGCSLNEMQRHHVTPDYTGRFPHPERERGRRRTLHCIRNWFCALTSVVGVSHDLPTPLIGYPGWSFNGTRTTL